MRSGSATSVPPGRRSKRNSRSAVTDSGSHTSIRNASASSACARTSWPSSARASSSRSSTRRCMRSSSWRTTPSTRRTSSTPGCSWRASTSSWPRITVSGVRSSCEASETNPRCRSKASCEAVEHPVDRVGEEAHLVVGALRVDAQPEPAAVDLGRGAGDAAQRPRVPRGHEPAADPRDHERDRAGEQEGPGHAGLGARRPRPAARRSPPWRRSCCRVAGRRRAGGSSPPRRRVGGVAERRVEQAAARRGACAGAWLGVSLPSSGLARPTSSGSLVITGPRRTLMM